MVRLANRARNIKTGAAITLGTVTVTGPDNQTLKTLSVNGTNGLWSWEANGQPGMTKQTFTSQGQTKIIEGDTSSQAGTFWEAELVEYFRLFGDGIITGVDNELAVEPVSGMTLQVKKGTALIKGVLFPIYNESETNVSGAYTARVTLDAGSGQPRKDLVVIRLDRTTDANATPARYAGRAYLAVKKGTAAASPVAPTLTQTADTWELLMATVDVAAGATSLTTGNISTANRLTAGLTVDAIDGIGAWLAAQTLTGITYTYNSTTNVLTGGITFAGTGSASTVSRSDHTHAQYGPQGPQGPQGPAGSGGSGPQGPTGPQGPAGSSGSGGTYTFQTTVVTTNATIGAASSGWINVSCSSGWRVTGGGCKVQANNDNGYITESSPQIATQAWYCSAKNTASGSSATLTVYAVCSKI